MRISRIRMSILKWSNKMPLAPFIIFYYCRRTWMPFLWALRCEIVGCIDSLQEWKGEIRGRISSDGPAGLLCARVNVTYHIMLCENRSSFFLKTWASLTEASRNAHLLLIYLRASGMFQQVLEHSNRPSPLSVFVFSVSTEIKGSDLGHVCNQCKNNVTVYTNW